MIYTVFANVEAQDTSKVSSHATLAGAGRAYQAAHTGNLRRVLDAAGRDVTAAACDAANAPGNPTPMVRTDAPFD